MESFCKDAGKVSDKCGARSPRGEGSGGGGGKERRCRDVEDVQDGGLK